MKLIYLQSKQCRSNLLLWLLGVIVFLSTGGEPVRAVESLQQQTKTIIGKVIDEKGNPIPGATITIEGTTRGVMADVDGVFEIDKVPTNSNLVISFVGQESATMSVANTSDWTVVLKNKVNELDAVTVVAFGRQKKESVLSSITTIKPAELKMPSSNFTAGLAGKVAGLISYQSSGEPGSDNASFFIRGITTFGSDAKKDPLILIDGIELSASDLSRLNTDDIASFSIMKDAAATSLYGARGANGVILVTTKEGREGKAVLNVRYETSLSSPTHSISLADPVTYMKMHNEAVRTRNPLGQLPYSQQKIIMTERGLHPNMYPTTDWYSTLFNSMSINQRANFSISGGGTVARYYVAASYSNDSGNLKQNSRNNLNSNVNLDKYNIRSNVNVNITPTTEAVIRLNTTFDDYSGPVGGGSRIYQLTMQANPVLFKPYYEPDANYATAKHILFGNYGDAKYVNPYAEMSKGYQKWSKNLMLAQFELKQDLKFLTEGLKFRAMFNVNRYSEYSVQRFYKPFYYNINTFDPQSEQYTLSRLNPTEGTEYLNYEEGAKYISTMMYIDAAVEYNKVIADKHSLSGMLVFVTRQEEVANAGTLQQSLPSRNQGLSGRFTYSYDSRYFLEANFGYNGSERFSKKERWGFFPSVGAAWVVSNEKFFAPLTPVINQLKIRGTYGLVGNDAIGSQSERFFYLSQVNMNSSNRATRWGERLDNVINGVEVSRYENDKITWEISKKLNVGLELSLFNRLSIIAEYFNEQRSNILVNRIIPSAMGVLPAVKSNLGEAEGGGFDLEMNYNFTAPGSNFFASARGSFTYATSKITKWEEPDYSKTPWLSAVGRPISQWTGLIADRLFIDEYEVKNSPKQFGEYGAGDIKYHDINGDGVISDLDKVAMGHPVEPEINYGFGASFGWKGIDFSFFFQGAARQSFWLNTSATAPFVNANTEGLIGNNALLSFYANDYWSEANPNSYAKWPRLSNYLVDNNQRLSTWFMQDAAYIRLKSLELGYSLPKQWISKIRMENLRLYCSASNLVTWSAFKEWDPEMAGNGLAYPIQRVFNLGVNITF